MRRIFCLILFLVVVCSSATAQELRENVFALTDKQCYLAGERLCVRVDVMLDLSIPSLSKVAYVEIADTRQMYAQSMVALENGQGWAEIPLPAKMHCGCYQLTAYTKALCNFGESSFFRMNIGVINGEQLSRRDDIRFLPYERYVAGKVSDGNLGIANTYMPGTEISVKIPECNAMGCSITMDRAGVCSPLSMGEVSQIGSYVSQKHYDSELEGHVVSASLISNASSEVFSTRLALIGKNASICDGKVQEDGSILYYVPGLCGDLPTLVNAFDQDGNSLPVRLNSPFYRVLPKKLPQLIAYCQEPELLARANAAKKQVAVHQWLGVDTLFHSTKFQQSEPDRMYDLDEWASMNSIKEILLEFVKGVSRRKVNGMNMLFTFEPESQKFSKWPALVLLDGIPVYNVDEIMDYDSHLVKYVQIYSGRFFFGNSCCQGVVSFITRKGRLSNYKLDAAQQLATYSFPQDHPAYVNQTGDCHGTVLWLPKVDCSQLSFPAPSEPGMYRITMQGLDQEGTPFRKSAEFLVPKL